MDLPQFMTNELMLAERVLIISNEKYAAKANGRHGGVGWESMSIQGDMAHPPQGTRNWNPTGIHMKKILYQPSGI